MEKTYQPLIIFDGVCNLCEYSVKFIIKNDRQARFKFVSAQSDRGKELQRLHGVNAFKDGSVILLKDDQVYVKSDAAVEIAKDLDGLWRFLHFLKCIPKPVRDLVYAIISKNRYRWFGRKNQCLLPDKNIKDRFL
ncbi:thiol-disulfide oxidoreductase DCC family protein [Rhodopseudomonas palustris]|nr:thiol-disulfide oxidoreductase DCC family protein [Rhodopseudomonas palustris]